MGDWFLGAWLVVGAMLALFWLAAHVWWAANQGRRWYDVWGSNINMLTIALFGWTLCITWVGPWWALLLGPTLIAAGVVAIAAAAVLAASGRDYLRSKR